MKKVIAIYSFPQECGNDSLSFVSCKNGRVILDINLTTDTNPVEEKIIREILSEIEVFYDCCVEQRYEVFEKVDYLPCRMNSYSDAKCTKNLDENPKKFWKKYGEEYLTILSCSKGERIHNCWWEDFDKEGIKAYSWKYTVAKTKETVEYIYHPEHDSVYKEIKDKTGVEASLDDRNDREKLVNTIAKALDYEVLNILYY